jgi:hypothetical protein
MIEPAPGQRGQIGEQHGSTRLTTTLEAIERGQQAQQQRDTDIQAQLATQTTAVRQLQHWVRLQWYGLGILAVLMVGIGGLVGWQIMHPADTAYARALGAVDAALVQQWGGLPKTVQEQLTLMYNAVGLTSPATRQAPAPQAEPPLKPDQRK